MSSIRPLVTITILVAVGVFLFMKINEGPVPLPPEADASLEPSQVADIPPLASDAAPTPLPPAPSWSDPPANASQGLTSAPPVTPPTNLSAEAPSTSLPQTLSTAPAELPPIPELPPVASAELTPAAAETPSSAPPIPLPENIPVASYPGDANASAPEMKSMMPPAAISSQPLAQSADVTPQPPATEPAPSDLPSQPAPLAATEERYGSISAAAPEATAPAAVPATVTTTPEAPVAPVADPAAPSFASSWPEIQGALDRQELVAAHAMLSRWYGNPTLTPAESQQIETLLSQLAGTIVYSTEHRLEPPYTVRAGDTLQTIAQQYEVPWQLLAKINGISAADMVQSGQQLKVIRGPFSAVVELDKSQLTLMLDGRYAGRFPVSIEQSANVSEGKWLLEQKLVQPSTQDSAVVSAAYTPTAVEHVLVLRNESPTAGGATISITGSPSAPSGPTTVAPAAIRLSPRDVEEVADILSIGSPITIRR